MATFTFVRQLSHEQQQLLSDALINDGAADEEDENLAEIDVADEKADLQDELGLSASKAELLDGLGPLGGVRFEQFGELVMNASPAQIFDHIFAPTHENSFFKKWAKSQNSLNINVTEWQCDSTLDNTGITTNKTDEESKKTSKKYRMFKRNKKDKNKTDKNDKTDKNGTNDTNSNDNNGNNNNNANIYQRSVTFDIETSSRGAAYFSKVVPFFPSKIGISETDFVEFFGRKRFTLVSLSVSKSVPIGKHFYLLNKCDFEKVLNKNTNKYETVGKVSLGCYWKKKYKLKNVLEKGAVKEAKKAFAEFLPAINEELERIRKSKNANSLNSLGSLSNISSKSTSASKSMSNDIGSEENDASNDNNGSNTGVKGSNASNNNNNSNDTEDILYVE